jgi:hypothetical protein
MKMFISACLFVILIAGCQSNGHRSSELSQFFSDQNQIQWCQFLPGLLLEMGTDIPLNNNEYCFKKTQTQVEFMVDSAHHYLNSAHYLVAGKPLCRQGEISEIVEWIELEWTPTEESFYLKKQQQCGPYGCAYQLTYQTGFSDTFCN